MIPEAVLQFNRAEAGGVARIPLYLSSSLLCTILTNAAVRKGVSWHCACEIHGGIELAMCMGRPWRRKAFLVASTFSSISVTVASCS